MTDRIPNIRTTNPNCDDHIGDDGLFELMAWTVGTALALVLTWLALMIWGG